MTKPKSADKALYVRDIMTDPKALSILAGKISLDDDFIKVTQMAFANPHTAGEMFQEILMSNVCDMADDMVNSDILES